MRMMRSNGVSQNVVGALLLLFLLFIGNAACLAANNNNSNNNINNNSINNNVVLSSQFPAPAPPQQRAVTVVVVSTKKNGGHARRYVLTGAEAAASASATSVKTAATAVALPTVKEALSDRWESVRSRTASGLRSTFLPVGFPFSVPTGYLQFSVWSWIQDLSTSMRAVLATQRVLQGVGVGSTTATALSAVQNFLVRDAAGMAATLLFTSVAAGRFFADVKRWRLFADVMVDIGISLEVAAVQLPKSLFLPALCLGNMCKAMCGVAAGATGGSIAVFWASSGTDISDINAKFGAQHTVTASLGLVFAALFAKSVATAKLSVVWTLYSVLTLLHIYANMRCMRLIRFQVFNRARLDLVLDNFFDKWSLAETTDPLPTPIEISATEPLFFFPQLQVHRKRGFKNGMKPPRRAIPIHVGVSFNEFVERTGKSPADLMSALLLDNSIDTASSFPYLISIGSHSSNRKKKDCIVVALPENTSAAVQTQAYFHATLLQRTIEKVCYQQQLLQQQYATDGSRPLARQQQQQSLTAVEIRVAERVASDELPAAWNAFAHGCDKVGWDLTRTELQSQGYEIALR